MFKVTVIYRNNVSEVKYFSCKDTARDYYSNVLDFDYANLICINSEQL